MTATFLTSAIKDMPRFGGDSAEFVRWKKSLELVISEPGDGIWSEIDEIMDNPTVPAEAESKAKFVQANGKIHSTLYLLTNGRVTGILYLLRAERSEDTGSGLGA